MQKIKYTQSDPVVYVHPCLCGHLRTDQSCVDCSLSWKHPRPGWIGVWKTWSSERGPCPWQRVGMRWSWGSFPTQTLLCFYYSMKRLANNFHLQLQHETEKYSANCLAWNFTFKLIPLQKSSQTSFLICLFLALHGKITSVLAPCCYKNGFIFCEIVPGQKQIG